MYQPYIRGKQFELIGIRELATPVLLPNKTRVSPIIEPVKDSSTLKNTIRELINDDINFTIIVNPQVGTFKNTDEIFNVIRNSVGDSKNYQIGVIFHANIDHNKAIDILQKNTDSIPPILSIIHNTVFDNVANILKQYQEHFTINWIIRFESCQVERSYGAGQNGPNDATLVCLDFKDYGSNDATLDLFH